MTKRQARLFRRSVLTMLGALLLAGCGPSTPEPEPSSPPPASTEAVAAVTATPLPPQATRPTAAPSTTPTPPPASTEATAVVTATSSPAEVLPATATPSATPSPANTPEAEATPRPSKIPPAGPTASPSPTSTPTRTVIPPQPSPTPTGPGGPQVLSFTVAPTTTQNIGDSLVMSWEATGERAEVCPIAGRPVEFACQEVPLVGSLTWVTKEEDMTYNGFGLRAWEGDQSIWNVEYVLLQCQNLRPWFLDDPPEGCPEEEAMVSYAAGQYFEHGFMSWVEETDEFYVFYEGPDEYGWQRFHITWGLKLKPGASEDNRVGEDPPPGLYEPVSGFGLIWRGEVDWPQVADARQRLGWATEPEHGYDTAYQCMTPSHPSLWNCFLRGPRGDILLLYPDSSANVRTLWERW